MSTGAILSTVLTETGLPFKNLGNWEPKGGKWDRLKCIIPPCNWKYEL